MPVMILLGLFAIVVVTLLLLGHMFSSEAKNTTATVPQTTTTPVEMPTPINATALQFEKLYGYVHMHGVKHNNRQATIRSCVLGESLQLVREPENPYDKNAIRVFRPNGLDVGYMPQDNAAEIAPRMDSGETFFATVEWINSPRDDFRDYGLKVRVSFLKDRKVKKHKLGVPGSPSFGE